MPEWDRGPQGDLRNESRVGWNDLEEGIQSWTRADARLDQLSVDLCVREKETYSGASACWVLF